MDDTIMSLIQQYAIKHPSAVTCGGEYIFQDDQAQIDAMDLVADTFDVYVEQHESNEALKLNGWILCKDGQHMPPEKESMFAKFKGTPKWSNAMFERSSDKVNITLEDDKGKRLCTECYTIDGKWALSPYWKQHGTIIAWRPFPSYYKEEAI